ncbi:MAG: large conductance mechanosensitive channel protein MscL [Prevotella sp.]|nr:large conductance mechanosensitive channel protein MscL [Prevotella sp.]MBQ6423179.1 large conductance mechanosensitive channel protein MscL [Prevotella sp.]MDY6438069.1 large conductance mechanosensitive channel protein MscL [Prevotella sp.]
MGFIKEFKEFAMKGNVMDMAVGVIIGGAFGKIISSLVDDIIMPLIGTVTGGIDFTNKYIALSDKIVDGMSLEKAKEVGAVFAYGQFLQNIVDFIIVALCIFLMLKAINKLARKKKEEEAAAPAGPTTEELLTDIRDLLKNKQ